MDRAANSFCELWAEGLCCVGFTGGDRYFAKVCWHLMRSSSREEDKAEWYHGFIKKSSLRFPYMREAQFLFVFSMAA